MSNQNNVNKDRFQWLYSLKPGSSTRGHLMAAALVWSAVGLMLLSIAGVRLLPFVFIKKMQTFWVVVTAAIFGFLKGRFVLDRMARKNIRRILSWNGESRCIGGFQPIRSWILVIAMISMGVLLRMSPVPRIFICWIYIAVGTALLTGSRRFWQSWMGLGRLTPPGP